MARQINSTCSGLLENTTDLAPIKGRKVLILLDEQNLSISAQNLGYTLQYDILAKRIRAAARSAELHLFTAADSKDHSAKQGFKNLGYIVHTKTIRHTLLPDGSQRLDCNIDNLFAFYTGLLIATNTYDVIVLASGDYGLAGEIAEAIYGQNCNKPMQVMTLSLPGSTAQDLDANRNKNITANLEIGLDILNPLCAPNRSLPARALGSFRAFRSGSFVNPGF